MSAITLDFPLHSLPGLPLQEGQRFQGYVRAGKLRVTIPEMNDEVAAAKTMVVASDGSTPMNRAQGAKLFVEKWRGAFTRPTQEELEADPRLAYLVAKHLK